MILNDPAMANKSGKSGAKSKLLKVVLLGDGGVGKSSLMNRFVSNKFDTQSFHTIGVEFLNKDVLVDGEPYTLQIWDTAGQERFKSLRTPFYRGADCCLLTYGVDDIQSFKNLNMWKKEFLYYADVQDGDKFPFIVLCNKIDVGDHQVPQEEAQAWCSANGRMPWYETSAKDAINVELAFTAAVQRIIELENYIDGHRHSHSDTVDLSKKAQKTGCCWPTNLWVRSVGENGVDLNPLRFYGIHSWNLSANHNSLYTLIPTQITPKGQVLVLFHNFYTIHI